MSEPFLSDNVNDPLNLISLAKSGAGEVQAVPQTDLRVQALTEPQPLVIEDDVWLLVLEGNLIIDLPYGDFRTLKRGDSLQLTAPLEVTLTPLGETVILQK